MFMHLIGFDAGSVSNQYPLDPDDFARCRLLLEQCPEFIPNLNEMKTVCNEWKALVENWDKLCHTMDSENPEWRDYRRAPNTGTLMKALFDESRLADNLSPKMAQALKNLNEFGSYKLTLKGERSFWAPAGKYSPRIASPTMDALKRRNLVKINSTRAEITESGKDVCRSIKI